MAKLKSDYVTCGCRVYVIVLALLISLTHSNQQLTHIEIERPLFSFGESQDWHNVTSQQAYQQLNLEIQSLDDGFMGHFLGQFHIQRSRLLQALNDQNMAPTLNLTNIKQNPGNYLLLLAKMYLYDLLPKSQITGFTWSMYRTNAKHLLAYFYLKVAAQRYQNPEAYYYLAVLDYYKLTPHETAIKNLQQEIHRVSQEQGYSKVQQLQYNQLLSHLKNQRFVSVEHNLFMSAIKGHHGAALVLANMFREGIGLDGNYKNCTTALSYYLSVVKQTYVDQYEFRSSYSDQKNFEKQLYSKRKIVFENQQNVDVVSSSEFFDSETIKAMYELADNYFIGKNGFRKNYVKAAELFAKLAAQDHKNSMAMLAMCYFKGQGVPLDRKRARILFDHSSKVSISQAMLIVMDYFQIQSKGRRPQAILKMKCNFYKQTIEIYDKKKQTMNPILKYLFANLIIKGEFPNMKVDDAILLLGGAAKQGHLMAKISMGLLFADGIDVNYDCTRAVNYFSEEGISHPFFMDKFYVARLGLKHQFLTFSLIKYLELSLVGDTNSFINALYILQIENEKSLNMNEQSWNLKSASQNILYKKLKEQKVVPDLYSFFQKQYSFVGKPQMKFSTLERLLNGIPEVIQQNLNYLKKKIIKVCAVTKENSLMNFYEYKLNQKQDPTLLNTISNGSPEKLHVLESRYLLGQFYHKRYFQAKEQGKDYTKDQYKALQEYKRATNSPIVGKILFYLEEIMLSPDTIDFDDQLFEFGFVDDLLTYTFVLSILVFVLYYKRSKKLDEIHRKQLEKRQQQAKAKDQEQKMKISESAFSQQKKIPQSRQGQKQMSQQMSKTQEKTLTQNLDHPEIVEESLAKGIRIGGEQQDDPLVLREYEEYKFEEIQPELEKDE